MCLVTSTSLSFCNLFGLLNNVFLALHCTILLISLMYSFLFVNLVKIRRVLHIKMLVKNFSAKIPGISSNPYMIMSVELEHFIAICPSTGTRLVPCLASILVNEDLIRVEPRANRL